MDLGVTCGWDMDLGVTCAGFPSFSCSGITAW